MQINDLHFFMYLLFPISGLRFFYNYFSYFPDLIFYVSRYQANKEGLNKMTNSKSQHCHIVESIDFMGAAPNWFVLSMPSTESTGNIHK